MQRKTAHLETMSENARINTWANIFLLPRSPCDEESLRPLTRMYSTGIHGLWYLSGEELVGDEFVQVHLYCTLIVHDHEISRNGRGKWEPDFRLVNNAPVSSSIDYPSAAELKTIK